MELLVPPDQEAVHPLWVMVGVECEVLGLLKEFGEHGAGLYAPTQKWMPCPNAKWRLGDPRVKSTRSGLSNWA
jgi:hypothetical protein